MPETHRSIPHIARPLALAALAFATLALAGCPARETPGTSDTAAAGPAATEGESTAVAVPPSLVESGTPIDEMPHDGFVDAAERITYGDATLTGNEDDLWFRGAKGPRAKIESANYASLLSASDLSGNRGYIIGRVIIPRDTSFPPFGIHDTITYVWVDSLGGSGNLRSLWVRGARQADKTKKVKDLSKRLNAKGSCADTPCVEGAAAARAGRAPRADASASTVSFASLIRAAAQGGGQKWDRISPASDTVTSQGCWRTATGWICSPSKITQ